MTTKVNLSGVHELDISLPGTTTASISAGAVTLMSAGFNGVNSQTGSYTTQSSDNQKLVVFTSATSITATLPQPGTSGIDSHFAAWVANIGAGTLTLTPTSANIDGATTLSLSQNQGVLLFTDGTNYFTVRGMGSGGTSGASPLFGTGNPNGFNVPSLMQSNNATSGTTISTISPVTAGNLIVVAAACYLPTGSGCTDNLGTSYTLLYNNGDASGKTMVWAGLAAASGACTATLATGSSHQPMGIVEFQFTSATLDGSVQSGIGTAATTPSMSLTTTHANDCLITVYGDHNGSGSGTPSSGWTELFFNGGAGWCDLAIAYQIAPTTGTYSAAWTTNVSHNYSQMLAAFAPTGTPLTGVDGQLYFDTSQTPYMEYVYHSGQWHQSGVTPSASLFQPVMSTVPTLSGTGLTTSYNQQATFTATDGPTGILLQDTLTTNNPLQGILRAYPTSAFTLTALIGLPPFGANYNGVYLIVAASLTGLNQTYGVGWNGTQWHLYVINQSTPSGYVATPYSYNITGNYQFAWLRYQDDGANLKFSVSFDGSYFLPLYTVAKSSAYVGSTGFNYIGVAMATSGVLTGATIMSWQIT